MTQLQTFWLQVNRDATIAWMHVFIRFGNEGPMTHLLSMFSSSAWWRGNFSSSSPTHVILCSWFNYMANTWTKFSKMQTIQHYAVGHLTRTHNCVRCVAHNYPSVSSDQWFHVAHSPSVEISTEEPGLLLPKRFECPCKNFSTQLQTVLPDKMFSPHTGSMTYEYPWPNVLSPRKKNPQLVALPRNLQYDRND
jgi:hypothetical protein